MNHKVGMAYGIVGSHIVPRLEFLLPRTNGSDGMDIIYQVYQCILQFPWLGSSYLQYSQNQVSELVYSLYHLITLYYILYTF
jgi:hypothetical protein